MKTKQTVLAIHEASGQDVTFQDNIAFALVSGGASRDRVTHVYSSFVAMGTDMFNFNLTGMIAGTLRGQRVDVISIPHILLIYEKTTNHD